jgi:molecular chaperone GrpE
MAANEDADRNGAERGPRFDRSRLRPDGPDRAEPDPTRGDEPAGVDMAAGAEVADRGSDGDEDVAAADGAVDDPMGADPLTVCLAERDEYLDSLRRLQAEFENYKKRVIKQQADQVARAAVSLLEKILPVLDTLDLAIEHIGDPGSVDGRALEAVHSQLRDVLTKEGLERISPIGERFDPNAHEAVGHVPAEPPAVVDDEDGAGTPAAEGDRIGDGEPVVAQVMRAGYRWRGAVVRPAMVLVQG